MALDINWSLLGPPVDIGGAVMKGFETGRAMAKRNQMESAFAALAQDPSNSQAQSALSALGPEGMNAVNSIRDRQRSDQEYTRQENIRTGLAGAMRPDGTIDNAAVTQAYVSNGDVKGLTGWQAQQAELRSKLSKAQQEQFKFGAKILRGVTDDAGWQKALALAKTAGIDISQYPPNFDPELASRITQIGTLLDDDEPNAPSSIREYEYAKEQGFGGSYVDFVDVKRGPLLMPRGDGTAEVVPRSVGRPDYPMSTPKPTASGQTPEQLKAAAARAIEKGADPVKVNQRLQEALGGAGSQAPQTFP